MRGCGGEEAGQGLISGWLSTGRHPGTPSCRVSGSVLDAAQVASHPGVLCCGPEEPFLRVRGRVLVLSLSLGCVCWALTPLPRRPPRRASHELLSPCGCPTLVPTRRPPHQNNRAPSRRLIYALCTWFLLTFLSLGLILSVVFGKDVAGSTSPSLLFQAREHACWPSVSPAPGASRCPGGSCSVFLALRAGSPFPGCVSLRASPSRVSR